MSSADWLAIAILAGLGACVLARGLILWRQTGFNFWLFLLWGLNQIYTRAVWRTRIIGRLELPPGQGAVIICNHISPIDPAFINFASPQRWVRWMVAREFFEMPVVGWALRQLRCIPVNRGGVDTAAIKAAIRLTAQGEVLGMLPEGRINPDPQRHLLLPGRPGAALVALKTGVPVVPCYLQGAPYDGTTLGFVLMPARVTLRIGRPIDMRPYLDRAARETDNKPLLEDLTRRFLKEIAALAGRPDWQPQIAGRRWKPGSDDSADGVSPGTTAA